MRQVNCLKSKKCCNKCKQLPVNYLKHYQHNFLPCSPGITSVFEYYTYSFLEFQATSDWNFIVQDTR